MTKEEAASQPSIDSLRQRVLASLGVPFGLTLSPALPASWPSTEPTVEFFVYESKPLPSGIVAYQVSGPKSKITVTLPDGKPIIVPMTNALASGREMKPNSESAELNRAQQILIDVVMGKRKMESAHAEMSAYLDWAQHSQVIGKDVQSRAVPFFAWLKGVSP